MFFCGRDRDIRRQVISGGKKLDLTVTQMTAFWFATYQDRPPSVLDGINGKSLYDLYGKAGKAGITTGWPSQNLHRQKLQKFGLFPEK